MHDTWPKPSLWKAKVRCQETEGNPLNVRTAFLPCHVPFPGIYIEFVGRFIDEKKDLHVPSTRRIMSQAAMIYIFTQKAVK